MTIKFHYQQKRSLLFEQEIYNHFIYKQYTPTLHSFAGDVSEQLSTFCHSSA